MDLELGRDELGQGFRGGLDKGKLTIEGTSQKEH